MRTFRHHAGFTLTELMVALVIALLLLAAIAMMFVNSRKAYNTQTHLARIQENGRFAMHYLMRDLRMASFTGCLNGVDQNRMTNNLNVSSTHFDFGQQTIFANDQLVSIEGIDNVTASSTWSPSGDGAKPSGFKASTPSTTANFTTDMVAIRMIDNVGEAVSIAADMTDPSSPITIDSADATKFKEGDIVLIANCEGADLFVVTNTPTAASPVLQHDTSLELGNKSTELGQTYTTDDNAKIYKFTTRRYFIRDNVNGVPSLYRQSINGKEIEIIEEISEGIESLQLLYGVDTTNDFQPDQYVAAGSVPNWANVVSVKIGVLARTPDTRDADASQNPNSNTYEINGEVLRFNDNIQRRIFVSTVTLKNRVLP